MPLPDIKIERFDDDPTAQGVVRSSDGKWQVVVAADGTPCFYIAVQAEPEEPGGELIRGWLAIDDVLPEDGKVRDLMLSTFGGHLSPEEEAEAARELQASREAHPVPCPRY